jgi:hypothetical protein
MRSRFVPALVLACLAASCIAIPAVAGGIDPLVPRQVVQVLDRLGLTTNGAAPSGTAGYVWTANGAGVASTFQAAAGGSQTPWTSDVDPNGHALAGADGGAAAAGGDVTLRSGTGDGGVNDYAQITIIGGSSEANAPGTVAIVGDTTISGVTSATVSRQALVWTNGAATKVLTDALCSGQTWSNKGATSLTTFALPSPGVVSDRVSFHNDAASSGMKITSADEIRMLHGSAAEPAYVYTTRRGSWVTFECTAAGTWTAVEVQGTWSINATTTAGFAYTPTTWAPLTTITTSWLANVTWSGQYRQSGDNVQVQILGHCTGAPTTATLSISALVGSGGSLMPRESSMLSIGNTGGNSTAQLAPVGGGGFVDDSANLFEARAFQVIYDWSTDKLFPQTAGLVGAAAAVSESAPITFAANDDVILDGSWPITP